MEKDTRCILMPGGGDREEGAGWQCCRSQGRCQCCVRGLRDPLLGGVGDQQAPRPAAGMPWAALRESGSVCPPPSTGCTLSTQLGA